MNETLHKVNETVVHDEVLGDVVITEWAPAYTPRHAKAPRFAFWSPTDRVAEMVVVDDPNEDRGCRGCTGTCCTGVGSKPCTCF